MGVDMNILLPREAKLRDIALITGVLAGLTPNRKDRPVLSVDVKGVSVESKSTDWYSLGMYRIVLNGDLIDGERYHYVYFFYESEYSRYGNGLLLNPTCTTFWNAVGTGLVDFFGGKLMYTDFDNEWDYIVAPKSPEYLAHEDNDTWDRFYNDILNLKPADMMHPRKSMPKSEES